MCAENAKVRIKRFIFRTNRKRICNSSFVAICLDCHELSSCCIEYVDINKCYESSANRLNYIMDMCFGFVFSIGKGFISGLYAINLYMYELYDN